MFRVICKETMVLHRRTQRDLMAPEVRGMKAEELCLASQASAESKALLFSGFGEWGCTRAVLQS